MSIEGVRKLAATLQALTPNERKVMFDILTIQVRQDMREAAEKKYAALAMSDEDVEKYFRIIQLSQRKGDKSAQD